MGAPFPARILVHAVGELGEPRPLDDFPVLSVTVIGHRRVSVELGHLAPMLTGGWLSTRHLEAGPPAEHRCYADALEHLTASERAATQGARRDSPVFRTDAARSVVRRAAAALVACR